MHNFVLTLAFLFVLNLNAQNRPQGHGNQEMGQQPDSQQAISAEKAIAEVKFIAENIEIEKIRLLPVHHNGRLKPLDTLSREVIMYINGSYSRYGVNPVQMYLALTRFQGSPYVEILEIRNTDLRQDLGFLKEKRFYSLADLQGSSIESLVNPILRKQQESPKSLSTKEKAMLEVMQQASLLSDVVAGQHLMQAADYSFLDNTHAIEMSAPKMNLEVQDQIKKYFQSLSSVASVQNEQADLLVQLVRGQKVPELFKHSLDKMGVEVFFNSAQFFLIAALLSIFIGICFFVPLFKNKISHKMTTVLYSLPVLMLTLGLTFRIYITKFAPVTNMYTTMIWVAFGVMVFSLLLFALYKNYFMTGVTLIASGLILLLTYQIPLILSPDLDPIVAVLRNNFWLSTHVTTITISYAAFTIAMVLGNIALVRLWFYQDNESFFKEYSHYAYRMIQLGCFLLTMGIILGGIWADYSWGRFWGWDPKETWALIADLGFLAILHARIVGWMKPFSVLAWSPVAYLLVIMAWYGVNFVLAAGLHSYGFSSGGAMAMALFVALQMGLLILSLFKIKSLRSNNMTV